MRFMPADEISHKAPSENIAYRPSSSETLMLEPSRQEVNREKQKKENWKALYIHEKQSAENFSRQTRNLQNK